MAVDHRGVAYVVYPQPGRALAVHASCLTLPGEHEDGRLRGDALRPGASGFTTFGMGFVASPTIPTQGTRRFTWQAMSAGCREPPELAHISLPGLVLSDDGPLINLLGQPLYLAELTGTGTGDSFRFSLDLAGNGSAIAHVDKASGLAFEESALPGLVLGGGWAFAIWGGDFYTFTGIGPNTSEVSRFRPSDQSLTSIAYLNDLIVGAGVSTCAPQR